MSKGKKIGVIIGVIVAVFMLANVPFYMNPELIPATTTPAITPTKTLSVDEIWNEMKADCDIRHGSPDFGFESVNEQIAWNDCTNKANSWYLENSP